MEHQQKIDKFSYLERNKLAKEELHDNFFKDLKLSLLLNSHAKLRCIMYP